MNYPNVIWRSLANKTPAVIAAAFAVGTGGLPSDGYVSQRGESGYPLPIVLVGKQERAETQVAIDLALIRKTLRISAEDLAKMLHVSRQRIYDWLKGELPNEDRIAIISSIVSALAAHKDGLSDVTSRLGSRMLPSGQTFVSAVTAGVPADQAVGELVRLLRSEASRRGALNQSLRERGRRNRGRDDIDSLT